MSWIIWMPLAPVAIIVLYCSDRDIMSMMRASLECADTDDSDIDATAAADADSAADAAAEEVAGYLRGQHHGSMCWQYPANLS